MAVSEEERDVRARARDHADARRWSDAYTLLASVEDRLDAEERELLATSAYLLGRDDDCIAHLERAYRELEDGPDRAPQAARCAFWLSLVLLQRGEFARAGGWIARGHDRLDRDGQDRVERGYLMVPAAVQQLYAGDGEAAERAFRELLAIARRFEDPDLTVLGRLGTGQALIVRGRVREGLPLLDEAMVAVLADEVSPILAGIVYCAVIEACQLTLDARRAQEWTAALTAWCESQPDLVPYRGQCQIHRAQILCLHGEWDAAMTEAARARRRLARPAGGPAVGAAVYQEAELHRLRGRLPAAAEAYALAAAHGHDPQPGLARLRLAEGAVDAAVAGLRRALAESAGRAARPRLLAAYVEATLAGGDHGAAAEAAAELAAAAEEHDVPLLHAMAAHAQASVLLAADDAAEALPHARRAWRIWQDFGAPYEAARARAVIGRACASLGDQDAASLELAAAGRVFRQLGAATDLSHLDDGSTAASASPPGGLTPREIEVLRLVAEGRTNRSVAEELHVSDKTVARHLSNLYLKLGVTSRAAATAWAYEHDVC